MAPQRVLVAFSCRSGSTAGAASLIAAELGSAGLAVDLRPAAEVESVGPYDGIVLGSGIFVASRGSDGGGFLRRFAGAIAPRPVWLFCAGPIGRQAARAAHSQRGALREYGAVAVARAIDARGVAAFGTPGLGLGLDADAVARLLPADPADIRAWARVIAADMLAGVAAAAPHGSRLGRHHRAKRLVHPAGAAAS
jgi:menaquinone-dependent protoporphyrinogen oxidase